MEHLDLQKKSLNLQKSFLKLKTPKQVFNFLRDLLTEDEILEFSQRLEIATRLYKGQNYKEIENQTGTSSTTIARVAKFLKGDFGGYRKVLK
ncbi:DNA-binding transcriptional regulator [Candidatus Gracilibacteria bacterium]|nr:DNA-binding transcriptional regulator [Candidatus Gracilibacteria bacterium]